MRNLIGAAILGVFAALATPGVAAAGDEEGGARVKEMLRRTQEALRQAQSDNADLLRAKTDAEQKLQAAEKQIESLQSGAKSTQASLNTKLNAAESTRAANERELAQAKLQLAALGAKWADTNKELGSKGTELVSIKQSLTQSMAQNEACEAKNVALYAYGQELLRQYKSKGVWAAMSQKEPVMGFKEVAVENVVQEYQAKLDAQRIDAQKLK